MCILVKNIDELKNYNIRRVVSAIGIFDGVHIGHRKIIETLILMSKKYKAEPIVITFYPHPRVVLEKEKSFIYLTSNKGKNEILHSLGVKASVVIDFNKDFARKTPEDFIDYLTSSNEVKLVGICVGKDWRFGVNNVGDTNFLSKIAEKKGINLVTVNNVYLDGIKVSSSNIRKAIQEKNLTLASKMLGRSIF